MTINLSTLYFLLSTKQRGIILILTFIVMAALTAIASAFLYMISIQTKGGGYDIASHKALWIAEGGIQQVIYQLKHDVSYRTNPTTVTGSLGGGSYSVTVAEDDTTYTLTSIGTNGVLDRKIVQSVVVLPTGFPVAFSYAIFGNTNSDTLEIEDDVVISGDVYYDGDIQVKDDSIVTNGLVYADSVTGDGTYTAAPGPPDPVPTYPGFDTTWYDAQITTAESSASSDWTLSGTSSYNLNGGTVYYKEVKIKDDAMITGTGVIVATKDVTIQNNANISSDVTIITKKDLMVKNNSIIQSGAVLYARQDITLKDTADVTGSLFAPENNKTVTVKDDAVFTGIIYADKAKLRDNAVISGSVVADEYEGDNIQGDVSITYNQSSIPSSVPMGLEASSAEVTLQKDWNEIPLS